MGCGTSTSSCISSGFDGVLAGSLYEKQSPTAEYLLTEFFELGFNRNEALTLLDYFYQFDLVNGEVLNLEMFLSGLRLPTCETDLIRKYVFNSSDASIIMKKNQLTFLEFVIYLWGFLTISADGKEFAHFAFNIYLCAVGVPNNDYSSNILRNNTNGSTSGHKNYIRLRDSIVNSPAFGGSKNNNIGTGTGTGTGTGVAVLEADDCSADADSQSQSQSRGSSSKYNNRLDSDPANFLGMDDVQMLVADPDSTVEAKAMSASFQRQTLKLSDLKRLMKTLHGTTYDTARIPGEPSAVDCLIETEMRDASFGSVNRKEWVNYATGAIPGLLFPLQSVQLALQEHILGCDFWSRIEPRATDARAKRRHIAVIERLQKERLARLDDSSSPSIMRCHSHGGGGGVGTSVGTSVVHSPGYAAPRVAAGAGSSPPSSHASSSHSLNTCSPIDPALLLFGADARQVHTHGAFHRALSTTGISMNAGAGEYSPSWTGFSAENSVAKRATALEMAGMHPADYSGGAGEYGPARMRGKGSKGATISGFLGLTKGFNSFNGGSYNKSRSSGSRSASGSGDGIGTGADGSWCDDSDKIHSLLMLQPRQQKLKPTPISMPVIPMVGAANMSVPKYAAEADSFNEGCCCHTSTSLDDHCSPQQTYGQQQQQLGRQTLETQHQQSQQQSQGMMLMRRFDSSEEAEGSIAPAEECSLSASYSLSQRRRGSSSLSVNKWRASGGSSSNGNGNSGGGGSDYESRKRTESNSSATATASATAGSFSSSFYSYTTSGLASSAPMSSSGEYWSKYRMKPQPEGQERLKASTPTQLHLQSLGQSLGLSLSIEQSPSSKRLSNKIAVGTDISLTHTPTSGAAAAMAAAAAARRAASAAMDDEAPNWTLARRQQSPSLSLTAGDMADYSAAQLSTYSAHNMI